MSDNALFTVGQKAFIIHDQKLLVVTSEKYGIDFPGGRIKEGEMNFHDELKREVFEETGLDIQVGKPYDTWYFETKENVPIFCIGYLCTTIETKVTLSDEHDSYQWVDKVSYKTLIDNPAVYDIDAKLLEKLFSDPTLFK